MKRLGFDHINRRMGDWRKFSTLEATNHTVEKLNPGIIKRMKYKILMRKMKNAS
jgi:hypothetical protein